MKSLKKNQLRSLLKFAFIGICFLNIGYAHAQQIITITRSIEIDLPKEEILEYVSDLNKDHIWRDEVDSMLLITSEVYGNGAIEHSSFGKNKTITPTFVTQKTDHSITFETPDTVKYYLASIREVESLDNGKSTFTYHLRFDNTMTKEISPFKIPKFITKMFYGKRMKKYLKVLKSEIEPQQ